MFMRVVTTLHLFHPWRWVPSSAVLSSHRTTATTRVRRPASSRRQAVHTLLRGRGGELQSNFAEDGFKDVLEAHDAGFFAVGADDDGEVLTGALHLAKGGFQTDVAWEKQRGLHVIAGCF